MNMVHLSPVGANVQVILSEASLRAESKNLARQFLWRAQSRTVKRKAWAGSGIIGFSVWLRAPKPRRARSFAPAASLRMTVAVVLMRVSSLRGQHLRNSK
jgi:hypothetical protein